MDAFNYFSDPVFVVFHLILKSIIYCIIAMAGSRCFFGILNEVFVCGLELMCLLIKDSTKMQIGLWVKYVL